MLPSTERLPLPSFDTMSESQRAAANELIAGPRKGVKGPFVPLLRSPELMSRMQKVGEYLRFNSAVPPRIAEFAMLCVARSWSQQFEWVTHVPLALKAGTSKETVDALREGRRPSTGPPPVRTPARSTRIPSGPKRARVPQREGTSQE